MEQKIIFAGPTGAGKTTAIASISDIEVVSTESAASDEIAAQKAFTTVAMDYGVLNLEGGNRVHLYGTPGQERFSFMWDILSEGAMGLVLLLDLLRPDPVKDLRFYINAFKNIVGGGDGALAIGVTHVDLAPGATLAHIRRELSIMGLNVPIFEVDARERKDVELLLLALLCMLETDLRRVQ